MIEAELAVRGIEHCSSKPYGQASVSAFGQKIYARTTRKNSSVSGQDFDCSDFSTGAEAQRFFLAAGGPRIDPNDLDRDGDGLACEWGTQARQLTRYSPPQIRIRRTTSSRCYTGPRGGTYTITSGGNRNYSGC